MACSRAFVKVSTFVLCATLGAQIPITQDSETRVHLRYASFDPAVGEPVVPPLLRATVHNELWIVQCRREVDAAFRMDLQVAGAQVHHYLPNRSYLVRMNDAARGRVTGLASVRAVVPFHVAYKLDSRIAGELLAERERGAQRYVIVLVDRLRDEAALGAAIAREGGKVLIGAGGNILLEAELTTAQLLRVMAENTAQYVQDWEAPQLDMDNARIQGGANYLEPQKTERFTGKGVRGHIMEGIYPAHQEFAANTYRTVPLSVFSGAATTHGNATFGQVFAAGVVAQARGLCPDGQGYFTDYNYIINTAAGSQAQNSRYGVVKEITDPAKQWKVMMQTASWGYAQITAYDARSAEMDNIIWEFDIPITQSQSNTNNRNSRPQAWAKNIISVGGVVHRDNSNPADDYHQGASFGPADDGRLKPDLCAYYDLTYTTYGSSPSGYGQFSGTSGATPIVNGYTGLTIEMFTDGLFGYPAAPGWSNRFPFKAHFSTTKALLINTAKQYPVTQVTREKQGWGFPDVKEMFDQRQTMLVSDELDVLQQGQARNYWVFVKNGTAQFRTTMTYSDPAPSPIAMPNRVNNLDLRVSNLAGTTTWHGNVGLGVGGGNFSTPGGAPNNVDTVENVYLQTPAAGVYQITVSAPLIAKDAHKETTADDADFALVVSGIGGGRDTSGAVASLSSASAGDLKVAVTSLPATWTEGFTLFSVETQRPLGTGNLFGLEFDLLSLSSFTVTAAAGNPFHFTPTSNPSLFPNAPYAFPPAVALAVQGRTLDAVCLFIDSGALSAVSSVARVTVQ